MGLFGVKRYDEKYGSHYFSILSPTDLSVSKNLELPFDEDEYVDGGSCGDVVYFYSHKGRTVIFNLETKEQVDVPPPKVLALAGPIKRGEYRVYGGEYIGCGVSYDAKSGDYKVIRIYTEEVLTETESVSNYCYDLYSVLSGSAKEITGPRRVCNIKWQGTSTYVGEAGSGSGSCYWVAWPFQDYYCSSDDPLLRHVLAFDFATERFDQFPMPAWVKGTGPRFELVECRGLLGVLVLWDRDEFPVGRDLAVRLFVRDVSGKGASWKLLYDVSVPDADRPIGLKDGRVLFLASMLRDDHHQLKAYYLASKTVKELDIYNSRFNMCGFSFGDAKGKGK